MSPRIDRGTEHAVVVSVAPLQPGSQSLVHSPLTVTIVPVHDLPRRVGGFPSRENVTTSARYGATDRHDVKDAGDVELRRRPALRA